MLNVAIDLKTRTYVGKYAKYLEQNWVNVHILRGTATSECDSFISHESVI